LLFPGANAATENAFFIGKYYVVKEENQLHADAVKGMKIVNPCFSGIKFYDTVKEILQKFIHQRRTRLLLQHQLQEPIPQLFSQL
jgi:hypothetical protein